MAGVRKIKNVRGALLPDRNLHCWILSLKHKAIH